MFYDMVSSLLSAIQFEEPIDRSHLDDTDLIGDESVLGSQIDLKQETVESFIQQDDQPPSADSTTSQRSDAVRDEWGHFADFQDELADESSFIPSCRVSLNPVARRSSHNKTSLQTLTEIAEDDDVDNDDMDEEDQWSFWISWHRSLNTMLLTCQSYPTLCFQTHTHTHTHKHGGSHWTILLATTFEQIWTYYFYNTQHNGILPTIDLQSHILIAIILNTGFLFE